MGEMHLGRDARGRKTYVGEMQAVGETYMGEMQAVGETYWGERWGVWRG